jgi:hypothetical protein
MHIHIHIHQHADEDTKKSLYLIINKLNKMNEDLEQVKQDLIAANQKVGKVRADVAKLHALVAAGGNAPTAEQWAEVKALSGQLNTSLQEVDDQTEDETPAP